MRIPRDVSGERLASLLRRYGYEATRQTGSHLRLTSTTRGREHHVTISRHASLKVGTLSAIVADVAAHLERDRDQVLEELFGQ